MKINLCVAGNSYKPSHSFALFCTLRLIIEKCLSYQTPLVLSFVDDKQAFCYVDRRALAKVLYLCGFK